jgi:hypothetical protein
VIVVTVPFTPWHRHQHTPGVTPLWMLPTALRTVGSVAARWAETIFCSPPRHEARPGHRSILRDPEVVRRTIEFLRAGIDP